MGVTSTTRQLRKNDSSEKGEEKEHHGETGLN